MDHASIMQAVREARAVVDEAMPLPAGPPNRAAGDLRELRRTAFQLVLSALLRGTPGTPAPGAGEPAPDAGGREWLKTSQAVRLLGGSVHMLYDLEKEEVLHPRYSPGGTRLWPAAEITQFNASERGQRSAVRRNPDAAADDIARMRLVDKLPWHEVTARTGLSTTTAALRLRRWAEWHLGLTEATRP